MVLPNRSGNWCQCDAHNFNVSHSWYCKTIVGHCWSRVTIGTVDHSWYCCPMTNVDLCSQPAGHTDLAPFEAVPSLLHSGVGQLCLGTSSEVSMSLWIRLCNHTYIHTYIKFSNFRCRRDFRGCLTCPPWLVLPVVQSSHGPNRIWLVCTFSEHLHFQQRSDFKTAPSPQILVCSKQWHEGDSVVLHISKAVRIMMNYGVSTHLDTGQGSRKSSVFGHGGMSIHAGRIPVEASSGISGESSNPQRNNPQRRGRLCCGSCATYLLLRAVLQCDSISGFLLTRPLQTLLLSMHCHLNSACDILHAATQSLPPGIDHTRNSPCETVAGS